MEWWFGKTKYCMTDYYTKDAAAAGTSSSTCRKAAAMESEIMFTEEIVASTNRCREVARVLEETQMFNNEIEKEVTSSNIEVVAKVKSIEMLKSEIAEGTSSSSCREAATMESEMMFTKKIVASTYSCREVARVLEETQMFNNEIEKEVTSSNIEVVAEVKSVEMLKSEIAEGTYSSSCREAAAMESEIMFTEEIVASTNSCREVAKVLEETQMFKNEIEKEVTSSNIEAVAEVKSVEMLKSEIAEIVASTSSCREVAKVLEETLMFKNEIEKEVTSTNIEAVAEVKSVEMLKSEIAEIVASTSSCGEVAKVLEETQMFKNEIKKEVTSTNIEAVAEVKSVEMLKSEIAEGTTSSNAPEESEPEMMFNSSSRDAEPGDGSSQTNFCRICMEEKEREEMFINEKCPHAFCSYCMSQHITSSVREVIMVMCPEPNCRATLEPHICKGIIHEQVFDKWCTTLCESLFPGSQRLYCAFKDCSAMLVLDNEGEDPEVVIREAECLHCRRLFCAVCAVPWHAEIHCDEFQRLNKDEREAADLMLINLAKTREWKRCPSCKYYVEKTDGCLHITCRCKYELCYRCGGQWNEEDHDICS